MGKPDSRFNLIELLDESPSVAPAAYTSNIDLPIQGANEEDKLQEDLFPLSSPLEALSDATTTEEALSRLDNAKAADVENNTDLRKKTAKYAAWYASISLGLWVLIVVISAAASFFDIELFSDAKFIAITTGATINSVAAFVAVVRGLFRSPEK